MAEKESFRNRLIARLKTNKNAEQDNKLGNVLLRNKASNKASENINQSKELDKGRINPRKGIDAINQTPKDNPPSDDFGGENDSPEQIDPENMDFGQDVNPAVLDKNKARTPRTAEEMERYRNAQLNKTPENIPGGESVKLSPKKPEDNTVTNPVDEKPKSRISRGIDSAKQKINQVVDKVKDKAKQLAEKMAKKMTANAIRVFVLANIWWILAGIALLIALVIVVNFLFAGGSTPNPFGKSTPQQVSAVEDKDWVKKILMYAKDENVTKLVSEEFLKTMKNDLSSVKTSIQNDPDISAEDKTSYTAKIEEIITKIDNIIVATDDKKKKLAEELKKSLLGLAELFYYVAPIPNSIITQTPFVDSNILPSALSANKFNKTAHIGTPSRHCNPNKHELSAKEKLECTYPHRTFYQFKKDTCDATDIGAPAGTTEIRPVMAGEVTKINSMHVEITRKEGGHTYFAVYAHVNFNNNIKVGTQVDLNTKLGTLTNLKSGAHLHFEFAVDGKCVVGTPSDTKSADQNTNKIGKIIWLKMAKVLNLSQ